MGLDKIIAFGAALAVLAASTGQMPRAIRAIQIGELRLLKESQSSNWPSALLLPESKWKSSHR